MNIVKNAMRCLALIITCAGMMLIGVASADTESEFFKQFKGDYNRLDIDLMNNPCEMGEVSDFVYTKDVATFTFKQGKIFLLRYVNNRPTTAIFIGEGSATVDVPASFERRTLDWCTGDTVVNEQFEVCFIRMADDLDLRLREVVTFEETKLDYRYFTTVKQAQGEFFFLPRIYHRYDNYFQLLRSCYERGPDGYFWSDFGRYGFVFDPNCPEEVTLGYEKEGGDVDLTSAVVMQRQERGVYETSELSNIPYPTRIIGHDAIFTLGGFDGRKLDAAEDKVTLEVQVDSLRFVSLFLNYNLKEDSIYCNGTPADYIRRKDFNFIGLALPEYAYKGDTITLRLWYRGADYFPSVSFVENPEPVSHRIHFRVPHGYNYIVPDRGSSARANGMDTFTVDYGQPYRRLVFQGYASGLDTVTAVSQTGLAVNVLRNDKYKKTEECLIPFDKYNEAVVAAFDQIAARIGSPPGVWEIFVYPESTLTMPGLVEIPQIYCYTSGLGGIDYEAGKQMGRQWFGATMKYRSDREFWLGDAVPDYLGLMHTQRTVGASAFFSELEDHRKKISRSEERFSDVPLAAGDRAYPLIRVYKGAWLMHMLRVQMFDLETLTDRPFERFLFELAVLTSSQTFVNADIVALAEKHVGQDLTPFFDHWLYGAGYPEYEVSYAIEERELGYYIAGEVDIRKVTDKFEMPVMMRVEYEDGQNSFHRPNLVAPNDKFELGPFMDEPKELHFNEFESVLAQTKVKKL